LEYISIYGVLAKKKAAETANFGKKRKIRRNDYCVLYVIQVMNGAIEAILGIFFQIKSVSLKKYLVSLGT